MSNQSSEAITSFTEAFASVGILAQMERTPSEAKEVVLQQAEWLQQRLEIEQKKALRSVKFNRFSEQLAPFIRSRVTPTEKFL